MPDLVGTISGTARARLVDLGLVLVERQGDFDEETEAGQIVEQSPAPGELSERGAEIRSRCLGVPTSSSSPSLAEGIVFADARGRASRRRFRGGTRARGCRRHRLRGPHRRRTPEVDGVYPRGTQVDIVAV